MRPPTNPGPRRRPFSTRIAAATFDQLDELVRSGRYPNRTAAIEAAVNHLVTDEQEGLTKRRQAFDASCGVLSIGIRSESMRELETDGLEWEADRSRAGAIP